MALDVITSISLDMQSPYSTTDMVHVNQYDSGLRVKAALLNAGQKWEVPSGAKAVVAFKKSDNIGGFYDATDDDPSVQAVSIDNDRSVIYISLDAQTTTTPTTANKYVDMQVVFYQNGKRLSTFAFYMDVRPSVVTSKDVASSWLFNILSQEIAQTLTVATTPQAMTDWLKANITQETGYVIDNTLTVAGAASDAQATGKMVTVSNLNPNTVANKVWVKKTSAEIQIPTMDDFIDTKNTTYNLQYLITSNGHIKYYAYSEQYEMSIYNAEDNICRTVQGSDFIPIKNSDYIYINVNTSTISSNELYIYFYDESKNVTWNTFNFTEHSSGERNRIAFSTLTNKNGLMFFNVTNASYIRVAPATSCIPSIIIWDGNSFGVPLQGRETVFDASGNKIKFPEDGSACIMLPRYGQFLLAKPGYTFIRGYTSNEGRNDKISESYFPTQVLGLTGYYGAGRGKNVVVVKDYNYETGTYSKIVPNKDLSDSVVLLNRDDTYSCQKPISRANRLVLDKIKHLIDNTIWTPTADIISYDKQNYFKQGCTYTGIPYRSGYSDPHFIGWHVTKHTFLNSVNDPDSIFYHGTDHQSTKGPYYSLVCSTFATLVCGFSYPMTNFSLMKDPNTDRYKAPNPIIGTLLTDGIGHCVVPIGLYSSRENTRYAIEIAESSGHCRRNTMFDGIATSWGGIGSDSTYMDNYIIACAPKGYVRNYLEPYNIRSATITNGSARPYRGDRSVYTSKDDVLINIKNSDATRLYYQKYNVTTSVPNTTIGTTYKFTAVGDPNYITITAGTKQVNLRSKTINGVYSGSTILENGAVYGVWTSIDDSQNVPPDNVEYFEWYDCEQDIIYYSIDNGKLVTDNEFWYACAKAMNYRNPIRDENGYYAGFISILYEAPEKTIDGTQLEHSNYAKYAEDAYIDYVKSWFRKGKFGAYTAKAILVGEGDYGEGHQDDDGSEEDIIDD